MFLTLILIRIAAATLVVVSANPSTEQFFAELLHAINVERNFYTILILRKRPEDCPLSVGEHLPAVPVVLLSNASSFYMKRQFNSELLVLVCLQQQFDSELMSALASDLQHMRQTRIVLLAKRFADPQTLLLQLAAFCEAQKMTNVMLLFEDFYRDSHYRYYPFPKARFLRVHFNETTTKKYFPVHYANLQGKVLVTLPDQLLPRCILYEDQQGRQQLTGYIAKLTLLFAEKYNASLRFLYPVKVGEIKHMLLLMNYTARGLMDIAITVYTPMTSADLQRLSYPMELASWLMMVPCPKSMPIPEIYTSIVSRNALCITLALVIIFSLLEAVSKCKFQQRSERVHFSCSNVIVNDKIIRGILGQSFVLQATNLLACKLLYMFLFLLGLMLTTMYSAYLKTLLTKPPHMAPITSLDDLRRNNLKILIDPKEVQVTQIVKGMDFYNANKDLLLLANTTFAQRNRVRMNPAYAYTITTSLWPMLQKQQQYFTSKIFCAPPTLLLADVMVLGLPLQENSEYAEPLNRLIHQVHSAGLMNYWRMLTFFDMVKLGELSLKDYSNRSTQRGLKVQDLSTAFYLLLLGSAASVAVFCLELLVHQLKKLWGSGWSVEVERKQSH